MERIRTERLTLNYEALDQSKQICTRCNNLFEKSLRQNVWPDFFLSHLQLDHRAFPFTSASSRAKAHSEKTASVSHLSYHDGALILHSWELTFIYNHVPTDTHSSTAQQCLHVHDGHLSGVFDICSHFFNLVFDFTKWQQPHQIERLLTAWCFC